MRLPEQAELPFAIQGELVRVGVGDAKPRHTPVATLLEVLESSPDRVVPGCRHFGTCGGCHYQHLSPTAQLHTKAAVLQGLLRHAGLNLQPSTVHAAQPWHYRNRVRLRVQQGRLGYSRRAAHVFLPIEECPILSPLLWRAATAAQALNTWPAATAEIEFFCTGDERELQLAVHADATVATLDRDAPQTFRALCHGIQATVPELIGAGLLVQPATATAASRRVQERQRIEIARWGAPGMTYRVANRAYPVTRGTFFQVNRFLTDRLVQLVTERQQGALALDLFAGAGLFSLPLSERFRQVVSVEIGEPAATDLALRMAGHRTARQTTLAFLREWNRTGSPNPDLVVVDPPRAGLGPDVVAELTKLAAPSIVSVSCDPVSFAREARSLVNSGYAVAELHLLDLFPQTFHMETVAVFRRT